MSYDLRTGRIPNKLIAISGFFGLTLSFILGGVDGLVRGIFGTTFSILGLFILFVCGVLGAGDIKLFGALGTVVGPSVIWIIAYSLVVGAAEGLVIMINKLFRSKNYCPVKQNKTSDNKGGSYRCAASLSSLSFTRVRFTVPIFVAVVAYYLQSYVNNIT